MKGGRKDRPDIPEDERCSTDGCEWRRQAGYRFCNRCVAKVRQAMRTSNYLTPVPGGAAEADDDPLPTERPRGRPPAAAED